MTTGQRGEQHAAAFLRRRGYQLLRRNYYTPYGEIDIICSDKHYIVFAEVKTRSNLTFGMPREYVDAAKQRKIILAAQYWLMRHPAMLQPRFDVIEVFVSRNLKTCRINHIPNAFEVSK